MNVLIEPLLLYTLEWDSAKCAVCRASKWKHYPFCRSCSIKLQCAHMMQPFVSLRGRSSEDLLRVMPEIAIRMFEHYDRARDFLSAVHAGRTNVRRVERHGEEECL